MKLVMTLLVRDEEDIVDATVRFHLDRGVDLVLVTDNLSLDRTRDLLAPYEREGVVRVWSETNDEYRQWEWVSRMAQIASTRYAADWVLHCDADEFWWTDRPLPEVLAAVPAPYDVVRAPRHDFLPLEPDSSAPFHERMTVRDTAPRNILGRPLMAKCAHRGRDDVIVAQGNHFVVNEGMTEMPEELDAVILHFPVRGPAQLERKVVLGGRAYARNPDMPVTVGNTWRLLHRAYLDGELRQHLDALVPGAATLAAGLASGRYVVDHRLRDALAGRVRPPLAPLRVGAAEVPDRWQADLLREVLDAAESVAPTSEPDLEERLLAFLDAARHRVVVIAVDLAATGVLAALAGARARGVEVRLLLAEASATPSWRLDEVTRLVSATPNRALVLRDDAELWVGPASLAPVSWHGVTARAATTRADAALAAQVELLWAQAAPVARLADQGAEQVAEPVAAGAAP